MKSRIWLKPLQFIAFFFTVVVILGSAQAQTPACFEIFDSATGAPLTIDSLIPPDLKPYDDLYGRGDNEVGFWRHHERYGVFRDSKDRLILTAKTKTEAIRLLEDIAAYTGQPIAKAKEVLGPGWLLRWSKSFDITDMLPEILRQRLEIAGVRNGTNCTNACLVLSGYSRSVMHAGLREVMLWLNSPLAKQIKDPRDLRPGDILAIRGTTPTGFNVITHTAIYVSPRLVISKNGTGRLRPWRLMDINEMLGSYMVLSKDDLKAYGPDYSRTVDAYRLKNIDEYISSKGVVLPEKFQQAENEIERLELATEAMFDGKIAISNLRERLLAMQTKWYESIVREKRSIEASDINPETRDLLMLMWDSLILRIDSVKYSIDEASR
jgi:hypothetical protein